VLDPKNYAQGSALGLLSLGIVGLLVVTISSTEKIATLISGVSKFFIILIFLSEIHPV